MGRVRFGVCAVVLLIGAAACGSVTTGNGGVSGPGRSSGPSEPSSVEAPTSVSSSAPSSSGPSSGGSSGAPQFRGVNYSIPNGFAVATGFHADIPLEDDLISSYYVTPAHDKSGGEGVVSIVIYALPTGTDVATSAQQRARILQYNAKLKFTNRKPLRQMTIAGLPGWREFGRQPPTFRYTTYFVFGTSRVMQLTCQLGTPSTDLLLTNGCHEIVNSLKIL